MLAAAHSRPFLLGQPSVRRLSLAVDPGCWKFRGPAKLPGQSRAVRWFSLRRSLFGTGEILPRLGINSDDVAFGNEVWNLDHETGFGSSRFQRVGYRGSLDSWFGTHHPEIHRLGQRDVQRCIFKKFNLDLGVGRKKTLNLLEHLGR